MSVKAIVVATVLMAGSASLAQSTLSIDDIDLDSSADVVASISDFQFEVMQLGTNCQDWEAKVERTYARLEPSAGEGDEPLTLDDVVNLGLIVDHEAEETCQTTPDFFEGQPLVEFDFEPDDWVPRDFKAVIEEERPELKAAFDNGWSFLVVGYAPHRETPLRDMEIAVARASLVAEYLASSISVDRVHFRHIGLLPSKTSPVAELHEFWGHATVYLEKREEP